MLFLCCVLMSLCLTGLTAAPASEEGKPESKRDYRLLCYTSEGVFGHGDMVTTRRSPCLKYRCENGRLRHLETSCPHDGSCHQVGSTWKAKDCHFYTCRKMYYNSYSIVRLQSGCKDANRRCRRPGDIFPYYVNGRYFSDCTCRTTPEVINYTCGLNNRQWNRQIRADQQE